MKDQDRPEPVAEVRIERDYWNRGHYHEGRRKELVTLVDIQHLPVGTKLYINEETK